MKRSASLFLALAALAGCGDRDPGPTVGVVAVVRGGVTHERRGDDVRVRDPERIERGATVETAADGRASLRLDRGAWILLDRESEAEVDLDRVKLEKGRAWVDASNAEETTITTAAGTVRARGATVAVELDRGATKVYCASGEVTWRAESGGDGRLAQGETLILGRGEPRAEPAEMWDDWTGGLADPSPERPLGAAYVGALAGRRLDEIGQARTDLPIRAHDVETAIDGDLAATTVVQTFFNARSDVLEAEYVVRMPRGAIVQSFAVDLGGGFVEGAINSLATEAGGYLPSWAPNATASSHLSYDGPDRLRARVHPIAPGATVRVKLVYTEWLDRRGKMRTWVYPMDSGTEPPLIGEMSIEVHTKGAKIAATRAGMGARVENGHVVLSASDFRPRADFYLDLFDEEEPDADVAHAYIVDPPAGADASEGEAQYVLVEIPTDPLHDDDDDEAPPLELVIVLDVSGATDPEDLELARGTIETILRQLAPNDRVAIRLADVTAYAPHGARAELAPASADTREAILASLTRVGLGGATDLATSLRDAARVVAGRPRGAVLYLGDGTPTTGALDVTAIRRVLGTLDAPPRFFALAIGDGANLDLLRAIADGHAEPVRDRTEASHAVVRLLAEAARPTLRGVQIDLGEGVERVFPRMPIFAPDGPPLRLVGRLREELPETIVVRGRRDGEPFERTFQLESAALEDSGDVRRRWASARLAELLDADAGREALVELGMRFGIVTPWTSLVVGGTLRGTCQPVLGFDRDPNEVLWALGGGGAAVPVIEFGGDTGWRRRAVRIETDIVFLPEETWPSRVDEDAEPIVTSNPQPGGDGGLAQASAIRVLAAGIRGPQGCYERKLMVRPDLSGQVTVRVSVDGTGHVTSVEDAGSNLGDRDVIDCIVNEVRGLRFPATDAPVTVTHTYTFAMPTRAIGVTRECSAASRRTLDVRRTLWRERLAANPGVDAGLFVWRQALEQCELRDWRSRRTLLAMLLRHVGPIAAQIQLYNAVGGDPAIADWLRRAILRNVRTPQDVAIVRNGLGLEAPVNWAVFARAWRANAAPEARLRLVRKWLEAVPHEMDLRLRLLSLLEQTNKAAEARRLARELRADPLADARVRTDVGEFWLRQDDTAEARRVFSELVEHAPLDPWARRRLGDLYRAHGWSDDAYREYGTLGRLRPDDGSVLLLLARAAADAGRTDEALRLEQRLAETADAAVDEGAATFARLWSTVRLARMRLASRGADVVRSIRRRERDSGVLRDPPALLVALTWPHPDDAPALRIRHPSTPADVGFEPAALRGGAWGIEAARIREREPGDYVFEIRREERDRIRDLRGELLVVIAPGTADERVLRQEITLTRAQPVVRVKLDAQNALGPVPAT